MYANNSHLREAALEIFNAGLEAVAPRRALAAILSRQGENLRLNSPLAGRHDYDLKTYHHIFIVGAGKASAHMALYLEQLLGEHLTEGLVVVKDGYGAPLSRVIILEAGHPVPDDRGMEGARSITKLLDKAGKDDLVLSLISGGGSALLPLPATGLGLKDKQEATRLLLKAGADIGELNTLRKHLSAIKGGQFARLAHPAEMLNLIISDVVGDRMEVIASGLTVPDCTTFQDALEVLRKYKLLQSAPPPVIARLEAGAAGQAEETPKAGDLAFDRCRNVLAATNASCLEACAAKSRALGFNTLLLASSIEGETADIAYLHAALAREIRLSGNPLQAPACIISGGETTVTVTGKGKGGRNQEFALAAALKLEGEEGMAVFSAGTDGTDGPTDAAGAIAFPDTVFRGQQAGLEARAFLGENDSYTFFSKLNDLIITGPTGTNVMDVHLVLVSAPGPDNSQ